MQKTNIPGCADYHISRRKFVGGSAAGLALSLLPGWFPRVALATQQAGPQRDVIVSVFCRGGMDGLSVCVPFGDANYYKLRPTLGIKPPDASATVKALNLDGFFGLHPALKPLLQAFQNGDLAFIQATGGIPGDWTRSHFDAQTWMEVGTPHDPNLNTGWLGRHLLHSPTYKAGSMLRGIGLDYGLAETLVGGPKTVPVPDPANFGYGGYFSNISELAARLTASYGTTPEPVQSSALNAQAIVNILQKIDFNNYKPAGNALYPDSWTGYQFKVTAALIRADIGIEAVALDVGGFDTHSDMGANGGYFYNLMNDFGQALGAFYLDLSSAGRKDVLTVGMSEFGRNAIENASRGLDHGTANTMFLMGGGVNGGKVYGAWPGLGAGQLFEDQDLAITTDYRNVLAEVVAKRLRNATNMAAIFPNFTPKYLGLVRATSG